MPVLRVALDLPLHRLFDYRSDQASPADVGYRVRVPFGRGERLGVIVEVCDASDWPLAQLKEAGEILRDLSPLPPDYFSLCQFASTYYQAPLGEVILQGLPAGLKRLDPPQRRSGRKKSSQGTSQAPVLTEEQQAAIAAVDAAAGFAVHLLHGVTGSGKTEVYLQLIERTLAAGSRSCCWCLKSI
jgi:primosomal protein N' (replication factor Y)